MTKTVDSYIESLSGWQAQVVTELRRDILVAGGVTEAFKWGHPIYEAGGPVCLIKAYGAHVTFGFWRGGELKSVDDRLEGDKPGMAYIKLKAPGEITPDAVARLVTAGAALNREKGDPLKAPKG